MMRSRATPSHIRTQLSPDIELVIIYEACFDALPKFMFSPGVGLAGRKTPETAAHLTADGRIACFQFGCCLLRMRSEAGTITHVLLDTGLGCVDVPGYIPLNAPRLPLLSTLREIGVEPSMVDLVVHSHLHGDHVGWNVVPDENGTLVPTFPRAVHCVHSAEWEYAQFAGCPWAELTLRKFRALAPNQLRLLEGGEGPVEAEIAPQLRFMHIPGHTPGHVVVQIMPSGATAPAAVYVGDALHHPVQIARPDWSPHFDCCCWDAARAASAWTAAMRTAGWDAEVSAAARRALLVLLATAGDAPEAGRALLVSPHFPAPGLGIVAAAPSGGYSYAPLVQQTASRTLQAPLGSADPIECVECDPWRDGEWAVRPGVYTHVSICKDLSL